MAFCRVSYRDAEDIEHAVELEAESLFEAVAEAVNRFRRGNWDEGKVGPSSTASFSVEVHQQLPIKHTVSLAKVQQFASFGTARGPRDLVRKRRLRELLGIAEHP